MKRIYKIEDGKKVCGVCGGVGEYFDIDPTLVRVAWLLAVLGAGVGLIAYFVCAIVFPKKSEVIKDNDNSNKF